MKSEFKKLRDEGLEMVGRFYNMNLNVQDFHDALFVFWMDYFKKQHETKIKNIEKKIEKLIPDKYNKIKGVTWVNLDEIMNIIKGEHEKD